MGRKCSVKDCSSESKRPEDVGVTFHKVPMHADVRPKWISLCQIPEDKKLIKIIYICSRHFLKADFCNFKGKKYMLKQGVLPSVFPWDKSKLEAIKAESTKEEVDQCEKNVSDEDKCVSDKVEIKTENIDETMFDIKTKAMEPTNSLIKVPQIPSKDKLDEFELSKLDNFESAPISMEFSINSRIEALDFNNEWFPAKVAEVDYEENEVLIHFEKFPSKYDEWICMNSSRLRPLQLSTKKYLPLEKFLVGERVLAAWSDSRKFPATVTKIMENDTYEVLFDDGFVKTLKAHRMSKTQGKTLQSSPLFDPIKSSKQDRREKKRKINVAALFKKRPKLDSSSELSKAKKTDALTEASDTSLNASTVVGETDQNWYPLWLKGKPVGEESTIDLHDGTKNSVTVADPRLPPGWKKHLLRKTHGSQAGKWDCIIVNSENRRFRSKSDIRHYLELHPESGVNEDMFHFSIYRKRQRKVPSSTPKKNVEATEPIPPPAVEEPPPIDEPQENQNTNYLKILFEDDAFKCPIEGCGKNFRRENLAQMHVKHYHPEYTKFLDSTPNVADLAYARTVGENLDKSPGSLKQAAIKQALRTSSSKTAKLPQSPLAEPTEFKSSSKAQSPAGVKAKDAEIIKLLSNKSLERKDSECVQPLPSGLPMDMYPDIKLKDLLNKSEAMPKRDDMNLKSLSTSRPPVGIKTLLPVVRSQSLAEAVEDGKVSLKRKRGLQETIEIIKDPHQQQHIATPPQTALPSPNAQQPQSPSTPLQNTTLCNDPQQQSHSPNDVIIEGGEVIKIVRMKQEEIINCTCGFTEEDGLMIQCELCLCWQHAYCNNIERESQVPEKYVCYICQNPFRERASRKHFHDQDWLKQGTLPTGSYHSKEDEVLHKRFEKLRKSHDLSGGILELREYMHSLKVKMKIAEAKNHPKLYLWSKPWAKKCLPEREKDSDCETKPKVDNVDHQYIKSELEDDDKQEQANESMLMMILKAGKEVIPKLDLNSFIDTSMGALNNSGPIIPKPEAAINSADCRLNLLEHISHQESLVEQRLDDFEKQIEALEDVAKIEEDHNYAKTRQSLQMLIRDLGTLKEFSQSTAI